MEGCCVCSSLLRFIVSYCCCSTCCCGDAGGGIVESSPRSRIWLAYGYMGRIQSVGSGSSLRLRLRRIIAVDDEAIALSRSQQSLCAQLFITMSVFLWRSNAILYRKFPHCRSSKSAGENFVDQISRTEFRMVSFSCESCQDTIKKPKLDNVYYSHGYSID